ncbi:hypothetical protein N4R57_12990 [Rhodobacteraceae bacterium D3-12]|nr:hypothetical protein N4R57_12990 [Rhodobacteraceae bacterium D3-12]
MIAKSIISFALSGVFALAAGNAAALSISPPCERDSGGMNAAKIAGWSNGHVLTSYVWEGAGTPAAKWKTDAIMRLIDCRSGKFVLLSRAKGGDKYDLTDKQMSVLQRLEQGEKISLNSFQRAMKRAGVATKRYRDTDETCTCKVYFPELRGNKVPFNPGSGS